MKCKCGSVMHHEPAYGHHQERVYCLICGYEPGTGRPPTEEEMRRTSGVRHDGARKKEPAEEPAEEREEEIVSEIEELQGSDVDPEEYNQPRIPEAPKREAPSLQAGMILCKYEKCRKPFSPTKPDQLFCDPVCRHRQSNADYRARKKARVAGNGNGKWKDRGWDQDIPADKGNKVEASEVALIRDLTDRVTKRFIQGELIPFIQKELMVCPLAARLQEWLEEKRG